MDLAARRDELKSLLTSIPNLQVYDTVPAKIVTPCAVIIPGTIKPNPTMGPGTFDITFNVQVLVQWADWESAQDKLDGFISTGTSNSIMDALEVSAGVDVVTADSYGTTSFDDGATKYGTVTFHVNLIADD